MSESDDGTQEVRQSFAAYLLESGTEPAAHSQEFKDDRDIC